MENYHWSQYSNNIYLYGGINAYLIIPFVFSMLPFTIKKFSIFCFLLIVTLVIEKILKLKYIYILPALRNAVTGGIKQSKRNRRKFLF